MASQKYLIQIKAANTHQKLILSYYLTMILKYLWMAKAVPLIILQLKGFGVVLNMKIFIYMNMKLLRELKNGVAEYIEFYNHRRFHQSLDYKKPMEVYNNCVAKQFENAA